MILLGRFFEYLGGTLFFRIMNHNAPDGVVDFSMNKSNPADIF